MSRNLPCIDLISRSNPCVINGHKEFDPTIDKSSDWTLEEIREGKIFERCRFFDSVSAIYGFLCQSDFGNQIQNHIKCTLSKGVKLWENSVDCSQIPALTLRREHYDQRNDSSVANEIMQYGDCLPLGQEMYHGGQLEELDPGGRTTKPLSLTFDPIVAYNEGLRNASLLSWDWFSIYVIKVCSNKVLSFVYGENSEFRHEQEVVVQSDAVLRIGEEKYGVPKELHTGTDSRSVMVKVVTCELSVW